MGQTCSNCQRSKRSLEGWLACPKCGDLVCDLCQWYCPTCEKQHCETCPKHFCAFSPDGGEGHLTCTRPAHCEVLNANICPDHLEPGTHKSAKDSAFGKYLECDFDVCHVCEEKFHRCDLHACERCQLWGESAMMCNQCDCQRKGDPPFLPCVVCETLTKDRCPECEVEAICLKQHDDTQPMHKTRCFAPWFGAAFWKMCNRCGNYCTKCCAQYKNCAGCQGRTCRCNFASYGEQGQTIVCKDCSNRKCSHLSCGKVSKLFAIKCATCCRHFCQQHIHPVSSAASSSSTVSSSSYICDTCTAGIKAKGFANGIKASEFGTPEREKPSAPHHDSLKS